MIEDAELVASELVANSVKHGLPPILMTLHLDPDAVIVKVHDGGPSANLHHSDGGRGLHLVRALTRIFELTVDPDHTSAVAYLPRSSTQH